MSGEPDPPGVPGEQQALVARLRAVVEAKDTELSAVRAELTVLRAELEAERQLVQRFAP